jgi:hypothetical protein
MTQYKIRYLYAGKPAMYQVPFTDPTTQKVISRRTVLFPDFESASDKARKLNSQFPDTVYQVIEA